ncbi:unknown protein (plasmid) [Synechocystis sp. PCC 6803]|uniref:Cas10/Cmr2 second palm domain-containing protein n=1 Tax=Synechocystis sp. (strain ATCC 27184 / PCC 6803 / Kazusa) TaxID=1111708 RepID=Q6ZED1_SYNY3|nr:MULTISPECIES: hypothetical protein [unclassified Synechocystis]AGF53621.1 hypothetical protein MYO_4650 [Synechocystis sp. PCC 6803]AVP91474.1 hypothetical protein C7I86_17020 [Synechocystis sp. IPPAS B-1465]MBD2618900.1 hypothetical protein [Synechocystis sp. FACHB-898]MBD2637391.1 hypothetical protein [Synechocystis sp. FACHB-908]MBD2661590.1 hypothetical protein [Synechocystis sp. FACHB-929]
MFLVLIETSGNQHFIFSTNKLRENIGASELTYLATTEILFQGVDRVFQTNYYDQWSDTNSLNFLADSKLNPAIDDPKNNADIEILLATSGKAIALVKEEGKAKQLIKEVTKQALINAPGLEIGGIYVNCNWQDKLGVAKAVKEAHKQFEVNRAKRAGANGRFLRLPIAAGCSVSELPASDFDYNADGDKIPVSTVSKVKRETAKSAKKRLRSVDGRLVNDLAQLEKSFDELDWLAVVHADGNGLGQILLSLEKYIGEQTNRNYIDKYRRLSLALDNCTINAFKMAIAVFKEDSKKIDLPIVPLILGGDDLTVICRGDYALEFTREFLEAFEGQTETHDDIKVIAQKAFGVDRLSACAGISIIKPHFPFSVAYTLAERLIKSAKEVKQKVTVTNSSPITPFPCSAIDFHILYDSSGIDFDRIREKLRPEDNTELYNRPYVVTAAENLSQAQGYEWSQAHSLQTLADRVSYLRSEDGEGKSALPSSQSHALRTALYLEKNEADAQYSLISQRYKILKNFAEDGENKSLFHLENGKYVTRFLDALDAKDFFANANHKNQGE